VTCPTRAIYSRGCYTRISHVSGVSGDLPVQLATRLPDWSAGVLLRCVVLPACPCVVSFSKFHEPDLLRVSSRGCDEYTTRKLLPWNSSFSALPPQTAVFVDPQSLCFMQFRHPSFTRFNGALSDATEIAARCRFRVQRRCP